jgi:YebC/PmpR family DNA-binding regulatory protein
MAGHNKWSKVKHIKAVVDAKKGKVFGKLSKELTLAAKSGGDPGMNPRLRSAILAAKSVNMPSDNIDRAIKKGTGELAGDIMDEALYEGFAPGGVALMVEVVTDNKNRSYNDIRTCMGKLGGNIGSVGSVAFNFERLGEILFNASVVSEDSLMELAIDAGAEDVESGEQAHVVYTVPEKLYAVANFLKDKGLEAASVKLIYKPQNVVTINDVATATQVIRIYEALDDMDDTQNVWGNFEIPDAIAEQL